MIKHLIEYLAASYFTHLLSFFTAFAGIFIGFRKAKGCFRICTLYFLFYVLSQLIFFSGSFFYKTALWESFNKLQLMNDFVFTLLEVIVFYILFYAFLPKARFKLKILLFLFVTIAAIFFVLDYKQYRTITLETLGVIYLIESAFLFIPCIFYYVHVYTSFQEESLLKDKLFWIATGLTFFILTTLPFSFIMNSLRKTDFNYYTQLYSIVYIFYALLFFMMIKGISCKPAQLT